MFQSQKFKENLAFGYVANISDYYTLQLQQSAMSELSVQVLTLPRVSLQILKDKILCKIISTTLRSILLWISLQQTGIDTKIVEKCLYFREDLKYITSPDIMQEALEVLNTTFLPDLVEAISELQFCDMRVNTL